MTDDREVSSDMAALLGALAVDQGGADRGGGDAIGADELARLEAEMGSLELRQELASHRALVSELRALPRSAARAPSPDWRALEAQIRQACDEVPTPRRWSLAALRELWRWPAFGVGAVAMASLALLLWQRAPRPAEQMLGGLADGMSERITEAPPGPAAPARDEAAPVVAVLPAALPDGMYLGDETLVGDEIDEAGVDELVRQLPVEAALALGATGERGEDGDARRAGDAGDAGDAAGDVADLDDAGDTYAPLLYSGSYDDELEQLDAEALRALDRWLEEEQKG